MKIEELAALTKARQQADKEAPDDLLFPDDDTEEDAEANLTEALLQLENCWALIDGLADHFKAPRAQANTYIRRELARVGFDTLTLLSQYNMAELHEPDTTLDQICSTGE